MAGWIEQVQHVRSTPAMQLKQINLLKALRHLPNTEGLSKFGGVVLVYDKATIRNPAPNSQNKRRRRSTRR